MVTKPPKPASGESSSSPFAKTEQLWRALITVEVETDILVQQMRRTAQVFETPPPSTIFWYVAPPDDDRDSELLALIDERRKEMRDEDRHHWKALDDYHLRVRQWRSHILEAKMLADAATFELDPSNTPVLSRAAIGVKRALQNLGGSVPSPMSIGDGLPVRDGLYDDMKAAGRRVSEWINDLRLVLIPRAPALVLSQVSPTTSDAKSELRLRKEPPRKRAGRSRASSKKPEADAKAVNRSRLLPDGSRKILGGWHKAILLHLWSNRARDKDKRVKGPTVARFALRSKSDQAARKPAAELRRWGYIDSHTGPEGGYWLLPAGIARLREEGWIEPENK